MTLFQPDTIILPRLFILLGTIALLAGCSSGDPSDQEDHFFSGPFDGTVTATFPAAGGSTVQSDYSIRLDLDEPALDTTRFVGTQRLERHASADAPQAIGTGDVFGLTNMTSGGADILISTDIVGSGTGFEWTIGGSGTISSDGKTIQLTQAVVGDPLLGNSSTVSITLQ